MDSLQHVSEVKQNSHQAALQVAQETVIALLQWADSKANFPNLTEVEDSVRKAVKRAKEILGSEPNPSKIGTLRLLFDTVKLPDGQGRIGDHWCPMAAIADKNPGIPYPTAAEPIDEAKYKREVARAIAPIINDAKNWQNLSFLSLILEKYGSYLRCGEDNVALIDIVRITGAVAAVLAKNPDTALAQNPDTEQLSLIEGDLSGIQNFIYTITSSGALKSLRARSFYLELVTEEIVQQILEVLNLPRMSVIYAGGGNLFILAPAQGQSEVIKGIQNNINKWLRKEFQGKVFCALSYQDCAVESVKDLGFRDVWNEAIATLNKQKAAKFRDQLNELLKPKHSYEPCRVCHRDDTDNLDLLNRYEDDSVLACPTCRAMFELGGKLFKVESLVRSHQKELKGAKPECTIEFKIGDHSENYIYYHLFKGSKPIVDNPEQVLLINNWSVADYTFAPFQGRVAPLLLGNYYREDWDGFMTAEEFAQQSIGISRVGYLRMDVDRLGQLFANGLGDHYSLPRLAGLSRQMSYFFKTYLNSLAQDREKNLPESVKVLNKSARPNLLFIYAGGDDLFVSGAWNEVTDFAFDVYQAFRAYTGNHPDITLSGGLTLSDVKYPLYQSAKDAEELEKAAKGNDRDSLGLFGEVFKWDAWLGSPSLSKSEQDYLKEISEPALQGVIPFVDQLLNQLDIGYSQSFVRNLLLTAQLREQKIREAEENQQQAVAHFLHLPKLAYTLSRLPQRVRDHPAFKPIRQSLMSPYNSPYFRVIATWIELLTRSK